MTRHDDRLDAALELLSSIDGGLLRKQRKWLIDTESRLEKDGIPCSECGGLISLTNAIADFLADHLDDNSPLLISKDYQGKVVPDFAFNSDEDVEKYLGWLIDNKMTYHFDDSVAEIFAKDGDEVVSQMLKAQQKLWVYCNPWNWLESRPVLYDRYLGLEREQ